jgi:hypothetical protein
MRTNCLSGICEQAPDAFSQFARAWLKASRKKRPAVRQVSFSLIQ